MKPADILLRGACILAALITGFTVLVLVGYILIKGLPNIDIGLFSPVYNSENVSLLPALVNTLTMTFLSLLIAVPLGVSSAIYMTEYAKRGSRFVKVVRVTAETLSGIPSILYGLFGYLMFVAALGWGYSMLSGALTLSIMILPLIMRTSEEALIAVPDAYREGSYGLGAGKLRTVARILLSAAARGIFSGIVLGIGRIVGETAALIYTAGTVAGIPETLSDSGRTLAVHMYALASEGLHIDKAYATAAVLLVLVVGINALSALIARRIVKG